MSRQERRAHFRRWLVEDGQGWDETATASTVTYRESDLDRLVGRDGDAIVLIFVGRFTAAKRVPLLVRAFARSRPRFHHPTSLVIWGGHPGEWEGEHPVTVAREVGSDGAFFAGWRGHDELPDALAFRKYRTAHPPRTPAPDRGGRSRVPGAARHLVHALDPVIEDGRA
jgi:glycosyltransferase involved in cell wall biosynthesis